MEGAAGDAGPIGCGVIGGDLPEDGEDEITICSRFETGVCMSRRRFEGVVEGRIGASFSAGSSSLSWDNPRYDGLCEPRTSPC